MAEDSEEIAEEIYIKKLDENNNERTNRWFFGGTASAAATLITHPLDLLKTQLQTQHKCERKRTLRGLAVNVVQNYGVMTLYNGLSAAVARQFVYSSVRFGFYEVVKQWMSPGSTPLPFRRNVFLAAAAGMVGSLVSVPGDVVLIRMQNDIKLRRANRRNYRNVVHGLLRIWRDEGVTSLFAGASVTMVRSALMTVGQITFYDTFKTALLHSDYGFKDTMRTHFIASVCAGAVATTLAQPADVIKTISQNAYPGQFNSVLDVIKYTLHIGPMALMKGYVPRALRLVPQTVLIFIFMEEQRKRFGKLTHHHDAI